MKFILPLFLFSTDAQMDHVMHCAAIEIENGCVTPLTPIERVRQCFALCDESYLLNTQQLCQQKCDDFLLATIKEVTR